MPRVLITGLPNALQGTHQLEDLLLERIPLAVEGAAGFQISRHHVYAHALPDLLDERPARVVTFTVEGLLDRAERTGQMRRALCYAICDALASYLVQIELPYDSILGWCVRTDGDEDGFVRRAKSNLDETGQGSRHSD
jgi:hypothetical protein